SWAGGLPKTGLPLGWQDVGGLRGRTGGSSQQRGNGAEHGAHCVWATPKGVVVLGRAGLRGGGASDGLCLRTGYAIASAATSCPTTTRHSAPSHCTSCLRPPRFRRHLPPELLLDPPAALTASASSLNMLAPATLGAPAANTSTSNLRAPTPSPERDKDPKCDKGKRLGYARLPHPATPRRQTEMGVSHGQSGSMACVCQPPASGA
ncbi:hypothetical protein FS749_010672, partial [Ceratobasidium sp. UAMH 11750]